MNYIIGYMEKNKILSVKKWKLFQDLLYWLKKEGNVIKYVNMEKLTEQTQSYSIEQFEYGIESIKAEYKLNQEEKNMKTTKFKYTQSLTENDLLTLNANNADCPETGETYTLKKCFYHVGYRVKDCKYAMHFEELNHGTLVGYDAKYFQPVDDFGNIISKDEAIIEISEEENPKWEIKNKIISYIGK